MNTPIRRRRRLVAAAGAGALILTALIAVPAQASHPEVTLAGSNFEIDTDANLIVNDAGRDDWVSIPQGTTQGTERRGTDQPTGSTDDSFGQGTKEDTPVPTVVDGSIPNNKSDLKNFGGYLETTATGRFLNLYWTRVQEPTGTTNMDFELNKLKTKSANGITPIRSAGDALIQYDLSQGGTRPQLFLSRWVTTGAGSLCEANNSTPCWGARVDLTSQGLATGSINTSPIIAANADGLGALSARTFGEAQIDFAAFATSTDGCVAFGSAYLKSRSSDSFTAALKDFIAPIETNFSLCGTVHVIKTDDATPASPLNGAHFDLRVDNAPVGTAPGAEDLVVNTCITVAGVCDFTAVTQGQYWVVETQAPAGYDIANPPFQAVTVAADTTLNVTFVDPRQRGAIKLTKTAKHAAATGGSQPQQGVNFTIAGTAVVTDAAGQACVDGLLFGSYNVVETVPAGYHAAGATTKSVTVDNSATCAGTPYAGETVSFVNIPLTNLSVTVDSQVPGGTDSQITCTPPGAPSGAHDTDATGDGTLSLSDLEPGTYTCVVVIDP